MALKNQWVGYLNRSYQQIKSSLLIRLGETVPEVTDHSESNILVVIISMFSGVTEQLNYYIDNMAREAFISTARRFSSLVKLTRLIDYRIKAAVPASVDLLLTLPDPLVFVVPGATSFTIPAGTEFTATNGIVFITYTDFVVTKGGINKLPLVQKTPINNTYLGTTTGSIDQVYVLPDGYAHNSLLLKLDGVIWERKETLGRSNPLDKHYIVEMSENKKAFIKFGDNINGAIPLGNQDISGDYYTTRGKEGNINANTLTTFNFNFATYITAGGITVTNELDAAGGTDYENIERIRRSAPLSLRTLDRAVTKQDFIDIGKLSPGVDKVGLSYNCGEKVRIYISPNGGGIAQTALLESTHEYIKERRVLNIRHLILATGQSYIFIKVTVTAKFRRDAIKTKDDIISTLLTSYSYDNSDINKPIRASDIIALIDNLEKVDYLSLDKLYLIPYFRAIGHNIELNKTFETLSNSVTINHWQVKYMGTEFKLFKDYMYVSDITIDGTYIDPESNFRITIGPGNYVNGNEWEFTTYPFNNNIETDDFTVPVTTLANLDITVNEKLINN